MGQESDPKKTLVIIATSANVFKRLVISLWLLFLYILCMALVMSSLSGALFQEKLSKIEKPAKSSESAEGKRNSTEENGKKNYYTLNEIIIGYEIWKSASIPGLLSYSKSNEKDKAAIVKGLQPKENKIEKNPSADLGEKTKPEAKQGELTASPKTAKNENEETRETPEAQDSSDKISLRQEITIKLTDWIRYKLGIINNNPNNFEPMLAKTNAERNKATLDFITVFGHDRLIMPYFLEADKFNSFFTPIKNILRVVTFGTLHEQFWTYPRPILKLNLIFSMGILGSLIFVTMEFLKYPSKHSLEMYLFRPFLGMIIALAMYVMVKSGYSAILESNDKDLSPFFISFLGIISGMLADQAYSNISFTGSKYFPSKPADTPNTPGINGTVDPSKKNQ
ncbi:MAG: hypothetical protein ACI8ZB_004954 [Desulforhopalus sp.]